MLPKQIPDKIYSRLQTLTEDVKNDLRRKGIVIPVKHKDGSVSLGNYTIVKKQGYYQIKDHAGEVLVDYINLPQSAAIIANNLALGKCVDTDMLTKDRAYGYAAFEEELHSRSVKTNIKKNVDRADLMATKGLMNRYKKNYYKQDILRSFEKLKKFV